jgi:hypothetical protein
VLAEIESGEVGRTAMHLEVNRALDIVRDE